MSKKMSCMALLPMVAAVAFATNAHAQRTISAELEEVIVTAEKREQNMQDVAISVSAIDAKTIESVADLLCVFLVKITHKSDTVRCNTGLFFLFCAQSPLIFHFTRVDN